VRRPSRVRCSTRIPLRASSSSPCRASQDT
jgi:hypothetical protein